MTNEYELTVITRDESTAAIEQAIEAVGGSITNQRAIGRRQFTYPIRKETAGYYTTFLLNLEPEQVSALTNKFGLLPDLLRHLLVTIPVQKLSADLEVESIKEAKDVEAEPKAKEQVTDDERKKMLDDQLAKLTGKESQEETNEDEQKDKE